jgi:hypothetical protein
MRIFFSIALVASPLGAQGCGNEVVDSTCERYDDDAPSAAVTIEVRNTTGTMLYLGSTEATCGGAPTFALHDANGRVLAHDGGDRSTCARLRDGDPVYPTDACLLPSLVQLPPGSAWRFLWSGTLLEERIMPERCYDGRPRKSCLQVVAAPSGRYRASLRAYTAGAACPCDCSPSYRNGDACLAVGGGLAGGEAREATATFELPGASLVELVLQ